jgi:anthranilate synthase component I
MKIKTSFEEFTDLAKLNHPIAISAVIEADQLTPISIFENAYQHFENGLLVEINHEDSNEIFMGFDPRGCFQVKNQTCEAILDGKHYFFEENSLDALRKFKDLAKVELNFDLQGFSTGIVGLVSYDAIRLFEEKLNNFNLNKTTPQFLFYCYSVGLVFDPNTHQLTLYKVVNLDNDLKKIYEESVNFLHELEKIIKNPLKQAFSEENQSNVHLIESDISDDAYQFLVKKAKTYIQKGDVFQVVLSRSFSQPYDSSPFKIYRTLRKITPAPYLFYMDNGDNIILGASPEKLVSVKNNHVETIPIAGTCKGFGEDAVNALLKNEKELAEHMMLVDLSRNDLGKVCVAGSIHVKSLLLPKKAGDLTHLTTVVTGRLKEDLDAFDALKAVFPAGTVSGAPKIRAMEIIDALETTERGFYAGAFCFMDGFGNLDSALLIRTMILKNGIATVRAGAGIVHDSISQKEAQESEAKAFSVLRAIEMTNEFGG